MKLNESLMAVVVMLPILLLAAAACGSDSQDETAVAAAATAERRAQAIAQFTAGTLTATAAPTRIDSSRPTPKPTVTYTGPPTRHSGSNNEQDNSDRLALEALFSKRSQAFNAADLDTWYTTCAPSLREAARSNDTLAYQFQWLGLDPPFD